MSVAIEDGVRLARPGVQHRNVRATRAASPARSDSGALAATGMIALLGLPFLLIASLATQAPIALPAALAIGYLAVAQAIHHGRRRLAARLERAITVAMLAAAALLLANLVAHPVASSALAFLLALAFPAMPPIMATALRTGRATLPALRRRRVSPGRSPARAASRALYAHPTARAGSQRRGTGARPVRARRHPDRRPEEMSLSAAPAQPPCRSETRTCWRRPDSC